MNNKIEKIEDFEQLQERYSFISCSIDCMVGWLGILIDMCDKIEKDLSLYETEGFQIIQIKEKYGNLRVHCGCVHIMSRILEIVEQAEQKSKFVCERCGNEDGVRLIGKVWVTNLCSPCIEYVLELD